MGTGVPFEGGHGHQEAAVGGLHHLELGEVVVDGLFDEFSLGVDGPGGDDRVLGHEEVVVWLEEVLQGEDLHLPLLGLVGNSQDLLLGSNGGGQSGYPRSHCPVDIHVHEGQYFRGGHFYPQVEFEDGENVVVGGNRCLEVEDEADDGAQEDEQEEGADAVHGGYGLGLPFLGDEVLEVFELGYGLFRLVFAGVVLQELPFSLLLPCPRLQIEDLLHDGDPLLLRRADSTIIYSHQFEGSAVVIEFQYLLHVHCQLDSPLGFLIFHRILVTH